MQLMISSDKFSFLLDSGDLQPGDKLPAERKLAEKFQVARSQVREAFKKTRVL